ncbi:MAG TPA: GNAT family N-acetyltransferase [Solirubrobacteraceae bacterium]|jgi:GNAT superfamily N-acetyltransferase
MVVRPVPVADTRALRRQVLRPHQTVAELASHEPPDAFAVGAFDSDRLVAVGLVGPEGEPGEWRVRGMATLPEMRGRGAGGTILQALLAHAREHGATAVWANVRTPARTLYGRAGLEVVSDQFELPEIGPHVVMRRLL